MKGLVVKADRLQRLASSDWMAALVLVLLAIWLFRGHFFGDSLWIGNPDRLNSDLKVLGHYLSGLSAGHIAAWNEHEMMGYDSFVLPYTFPNPLVFLVALFGEDNRCITMGYVAIAMLASAGLASYSFLRADLPAGIPVLVGAICYEFSSLTVLKVSQNSMSFAVFIMIPLLALAVRLIRRGTAANCFLVLAFLLTSMLSLMFLQKAAYALMLVGSYAAWRSLTGRSWRPALVFGLALGAAVAFSLPRIVGVARAMREYARAVDGLDLKDFAVLYDFQKILPYQICRWFDYAIFGHSPSESQLLGTNLNLTEGFLLHTSTVVPFLLLTGLVRRRRGWTNIFRAPRDEAAFFFWALLACILAVVWKPAAHALFVLFLRMDFTHARILISALLPLALLVALTLHELSPQDERAGRWLHTRMAGLAIGLFAALCINVFARRFPGATRVLGGPNMLNESLIRIGLSLVLYLTLLAVVLRCWNTAIPKRVAHTAICALIVSQCALAANEQVNAPYTRNFLQPFNKGDFYQAQRAEFRPPTDEQVSALHLRIEPDRYRVALICDQEIAGGFCAGHVPEFWKLRAVDGYYGLGVPVRLRALPWPNGPSLRTISFLNRRQIPWDLLGFLNVRSVLVAGDGVYRNIVRDGFKVISRPDPATFRIIPSPARVTPRVFFASGVEPVASPQDAANRLFQPEGIVDPVSTSFVEGLGKARHFENDGVITLQGHGDLLELRFHPAPTERFLVLNDLYYPGWHATIDGRERPVFATNAVMRGVVVPPGADHLQFRYVTYALTPGAWTLRAFAALVALGVFFVLRRNAGEQTLLDARGRQE
jgi:hypothetical protein